MADYTDVPAALPAVDWFAITPSDTADMARTPRAIYVGGAGNVAVRSREGNDVTFTAPPVGTVLHIAPVRVLVTGTSATLLIGLI
jgi:hypothetical protein